MLPISPSMLALFITYLSKNLAPNTIRTYISVLSYYHGLPGLECHTRDYLPRKLLDSVEKTGRTPKSLLPIDISRLKRILDNYHLLLDNDYDKVMFKALFLALYYLCARIGELTLSHGNAKNVVTLNDVRLVKNGPFVRAYKVYFQNFKHNRKGNVHQVQVSETTDGYCPVNAMESYLKLRGSYPGPLFGTKLGSPLLAYRVLSLVRGTLEVLGESPSNFGTHSFRVGRCTDYALSGASSTQIRLLGRWHSDAFRKYIRPTMLK